MGEPWTLQRTVQCAKCPWKKSTDPRAIPGGYSVRQHRSLADTIANHGDLRTVLKPTHIMACHETLDAHCVGWLVNQIGVGNNIGLRVRMMTCTNGNDIKVFGEQHERFKDTLPPRERK